MARLCIVALTASAMEGDAGKCLASGMDDYSAKPVGVATLAETLRRWIGQREAQRAPARLPN